MPGTGIDSMLLIAWCEQECGAEWRAWVQALPLTVEAGEPRRYSRFYFLNAKMAERFIATWLE